MISFLMFAAVEACFLRNAVSTILWHGGGAFSAGSMAKPVGLETNAESQML